MLYKLDLPPSKYRYIKKLAITYIALWVNRCFANPTREPNQLSITQVLININIKRIGIMPILHFVLKLLVLR